MNATNIGRSFDISGMNVLYSALYKVLAVMECALSHRIFGNNRVYRLPFLIIQQQEIE